MSEMVVRRVQTEIGSHIEPPLDQNASQFDQLRWLAAVVSVDTGLAITVNEQPRGPLWVRGRFGFSIGKSSIAAYDFNGAWAFLTGVGVGARESRPRP